MNDQREAECTSMFYHHLRNELWKLFGKKRTYIGFGAFLLAQNAMLLMFRFTHWQRHWSACSPATVTWRRNMFPR